MILYFSFPGHSCRPLNIPSKHYSRVDKLRQDLAPFLPKASFLNHSETWLSSLVQRNSSHRKTGAHLRKHSHVNLTTITHGHTCPPPSAAALPKPQGMEKVCQVSPSRSWSMVGSQAACGWKGRATFILLQEWSHPNKSLLDKSERGRRGGIGAGRPIIFHLEATRKPDLLRQSRAWRDLKMQKGSSCVFCKLLTGTFFLTVSKDARMTHLRKKAKKQSWS